MSCAFVDSKSGWKAKAKGGRDASAGWLLILPLVLVLVPFFIVPIVGVVAASFVQSDGFGGIIPSFTLENYEGVFTSGLTYQLYWATLKFAVFDLVLLAADRLLDRLFPGVPCPQPAAGDRAVPDLHGAVLDLEHHPHDFVDSAARQGRADQQRADRRPVSSTSRSMCCCSRASRW